MSSLRNAVKRSTHKERAQPSSRHKFGLLEKKKDYLQRAHNHQKKEQTLKILREKAEQRNPDEYYQAMQRDQLHGANPEAGRMTDAQIKDLKSQDLLHVQVQSRKHKKRLERLQESLHFIGAPAQNSHAVFVESPAAVRAFSAEAHFDTPAPLLGRSFNRPRVAQLDAASAAAPDPDAAAAPDRAAARQAKRRASAYQRLLDAKESSQKLEQLAGDMRAARAAGLCKGHRRPVREDGGTGKVVGQRFKRVRQR